MADPESMNVMVLTRPAATVPDHVPDYDKIDDPQATAIPTLHSLRDEDMERRTSAATQRSDPDRTMTLVEPEDPRVTGTIASPRGMLVLMVTCTAQLLDLILMTSVNIALPTVQRELHIQPGNLQWVVSAYTLSFGGFLLLAGVLADRYTKRAVFTGGMTLLAVASLACGLASSEIMLMVCRALQGLGAAATVPSAIGVLSTFFRGQNRHRALSCYGAAGAVGFSAGLVLGGLVTGTIGWRWVFRFIAPLCALLSVAGWFTFPADARAVDGRQPALDLPGAALGTSGMILFAFALSSSDAYGWSRAIVLAPLLVSVAVLGAFTWNEKKVRNPIMPMHLWRLPSFAAIWVAAFFTYGWWSSVVYYVVLIAQDVIRLSPLGTALRLIPMGVVGFVVSVAVGRLVEVATTRTLVCSALVLCIGSVVPAALLSANITSVAKGTGFWAFVFPTTMLSVSAVSVAYNVLSITLLSTVPSGAKSLAGGLVNTAFQLGAGVGLAICGTISSTVRLKNGDADSVAALMAGYSAALWAAGGMAGAALFASVLGIRGGLRATGEAGTVH